MWPLKKRYSRESVEYIISNILNETVDRSVLRDIFIENIDPLISDQKFDVFYEKLNEAEKILDRRKIEYWINKLDALKEHGVF